MVTRVTLITMTAMTTLACPFNNNLRDPTSFHRRLEQTLIRKHSESDPQAYFDALKVPK